MTRALSLFLVAAVAACGPTAKGHAGDGGDDVDAAGSDAGSNQQPHTLSALTIDPLNPLVQLDLNTAGAQPFTVTGIYLDGTQDDQTANATFTVMNPAVGAMSGATLMIPAFAAADAEVSVIQAQVGTLSTMAQITVVAYRSTGTQQDFFFILPYNDTAGPQSKPLDFSTAVPALDVFFLMDTTGSMAGEIANLQSALTGTVIPGIMGAVSDSQFGVGALEDFPVDGYGSYNSAQECFEGDNAPDQPLKLRQEITDNTTLVSNAVAGLRDGAYPIGCGDDWPEGSLESIYQAATGEGLTGPSPTNVPANHDGVGGVAFRQGTMPVIVTISDADSHGKGETGNCFGTQEGYDANVSAVAHTRQDTKNALTGICSRFVGLAAQTGNGADCEPNGYMTDLATTTGARVPPAAWDFGTRPSGCSATQCCTGLGGAGQAPDGNGLCPLVFNVNTDGTGVGTSVATGVEMLARFATFTVPTETDGVGTDTAGNPLPTPHTTADFIKAVTPTSFVLPPPPPNLPNPTFDATTFYNVTPGTTITYGVNAFNDFVPQTADAQIFRATIKVTAGGCTPLDQRDVLILVPPAPIVTGRLAP
ncbi:MAG TPA: hypothetical protein VGM88_32905 [Kofleriaceae bacterium]|jgi:hypothetical protein